MSTETPWQPIETAPKDGTLFDVWAGSGNGRIVDASFDPESGLYVEYVVHGGCHGGEYEPIDPQPTHWMPLPPAPKA